MTGIYRDYSASTPVADEGVSKHVGMGAVRFSLGRDATKDEIDSIVNQLRSNAAS